MKYGSTTASGAIGRAPLEAKDVLMTPAHRHTTGIARREFLQVGFSGFLGLGIDGLPEGG